MPIYQAEFHNPNDGGHSYAYAVVAVDLFEVAEALEALRTRAPDTICIADLVRVTLITRCTVIRAPTKH